MPGPVDVAEHARQDYDGRCHAGAAGQDSRGASADGWLRFGLSTVVTDPYRPWLDHADEKACDLPQESLDAYCADSLKTGLSGTSRGKRLEARVPPGAREPPGTTRSGTIGDRCSRTPRC
jgi:hypothetical protein